MYTTNLPDAVVIPDALLALVERGVLDDHARAVMTEWAQATAQADDFMRGFWRQHVRSNIEQCQCYGIPECVALFSYVGELIEELWPE